MPLQFRVDVRREIPHRLGVLVRPLVFEAIVQVTTEEKVPSVLMFATVGRSVVGGEAEKLPRFFEDHLNMNHILRMPGIGLAHAVGLNAAL